MNNIHPSEKEIQQYALNKSDCTPAMTAHIESCADCRAEVSSYHLLFSEIKQQTGAAFDFDLSALILQKLPKSRPQLSADQFVAGFLIFFICFCISIPLYLFRQYLLNMFGTISSFFIYSIIISAVIIILYTTLNIYKKYQKQMRQLNFN